MKSAVTTESGPESATAEAANGLPGAAARAPEGLAWVTVKVLVAEAGSNAEFPVWLTVIEHGPIPKSMTRLPATLHTAGVAEVNVSGSFAEDRAAIPKGEPPRI